MTAKIITALIVLLVNIGAGFVFFLMLGLSLNGFSERDSTPSFYVYFIGVLLVTIATTAAGFFGVHHLTVRKNFNPWFVVIGVSFLLSVIVVIAGFILTIIGAITASEIRNGYLR